MTRSRPNHAGSWSCLLGLFLLYQRIGLVVAAAQQAWPPDLTQATPLAVAELASPVTAFANTFGDRLAPPPTHRVGPQRPRQLIPGAYLLEYTEPASFERIVPTLADALGSRQAFQPRQHIDSSLFHGVSIQVMEDHDPDVLKKLPNVRSVTPVYAVPPPSPLSTYNRDDRGSINDKTYEASGIRAVHETLNVWGAGVGVAIIDTGVDYRHPALGGGFGPGYKVAKGWDFVGDDYGIQNPHIQPDGDPMDNCSKSSHGTHVAGIVAGDARGIGGVFQADDPNWYGVAPQATLGAYRVFGCPGDTTATDLIAAAIYKAFDDGFRIISISVGGGPAFQDGGDGKAAKAVAEQGGLVVAAQGNDGKAGMWVGSSPGVQPEVIAVGSFDALEMLQPGLRLPNDTSVPYRPATHGGGWTGETRVRIVPNQPDAGATAQIDDDGCHSVTANAAGHVVLFVHGKACNSEKRCGNAKAAGATGCLIYDNTAESDFAILGSDDIPSAALSHASGQAILDQIARNGTTEFVISDHMAPIPVASGGSPSDFSSWGPAPDLKVKPDIAGFGSRIFSTISRHAAEVAGRPTPYASYSGTSMATPYISGCLALFLAAKGDRARGLMLPDIRTLLQNAAQPGLDFRTHMKASVGLQGAGLIHVMNMIRADATANPSRLFLNDTDRLQPYYEVTVSNRGARGSVFIAQHQAAETVYPKNPGVDQLLLRPKPLFGTANEAHVVVTPDRAWIDAGGTATFRIAFTPPVRPDPALIPVYSGWIIFETSTEERALTLRVPYLGIKGDFDNAPVLVADNPDGRVTTLWFPQAGQELLIRRVAAAPRAAVAPPLVPGSRTAAPLVPLTVLRMPPEPEPADDALPSFRQFDTATDGATAAAGATPGAQEDKDPVAPAVARIALALNARVLMVDIVDGATSDGVPGISRGLIWTTGGDFNEGAMYAINVGRTCDLEDAQSVSTYLAIGWDGRVVLKPGAAPTALPAGKYRMRISALKPFGNPRDMADFHMAVTTPFLIK